MRLIDTAPEMPTPEPCAADWAPAGRLLPARGLFPPGCCLDVSLLIKVPATVKVHSSPSFRARTPMALFQGLPKASARSRVMFDDAGLLAAASAALSRDEISPM